MADKKPNLVLTASVVAVLSLGLAACGDDSSSASDAAPSSTSSDLPQSTPVSTEPAGPVEGLPDLPDGMVEMSIGSPDAPLTMVEFASLTCSHCRTFAVERLPDLKEKYIDTGYLRLIFRDYPLDGYALRAAMIARCAGPDRYFAYIDAYFHQQSSWLSGDPMEGLKRVARNGGMSTAEIDECLDNRELSQNIVEAMQTATTELNVGSTPTFLFEGSTFAGARAVSEYEELFDAALEKKGITAP